MIVCWSPVLQAQQKAMFSQYMFNQYTINPAYTGTTDNYYATSNYRHQWFGIAEAPRTYTLTVQGPGKSGNYGLGGSIYNDVTGPTSKSGIYLSYAYHFKLTRTQNISMGLSGGLMQYKVDGTKVTVFDPGDQVLTNQRLTTLLPDFGFGLYWYEKEKFYLGISTPQFVQSRISYTDNGVKSLSNLTIHYFLNGGYTFNLTSDFDIEPSFLVKYSAPVDVQLDAGARVIFRKMIWLGAVYRTEDAIAAMVGYTTPNKRLSFGYSYDFTRTNLSKYSFGSHELMVKVRFKSKKAYSAKGKAKKKAFEQLQEDLEGYELEQYEKEEKEKKEEAEKEKLRKELEEINTKDQELRNKVRDLRKEASDEGYSTPKDKGFSKRMEYLGVLQDIKSLYQRKKEIESILNK